MAMVYQKGTVYPMGSREKKWYGKFRVYLRDREGKEVEKTRKVVLGLKSKLRKWEAEEILQQIIRRENAGGGEANTQHQPHDESVTFGWFVEERYLAMRRGLWRPATRRSAEFEIRRHLVARFKDTPLRKISGFDFQMTLNDLARQYAASTVKHIYVYSKAIMRQARKLKFITENPTEDLALPDLKPVSRPTLQPEQIMALLNSIHDPHDRCLMYVALFCGTRTSETLGLQWKCFTGDRLIPCGTAYEGVFYEGKLKTARSGDSIPVPASVRRVIDAWRVVCTNASSEALMFPVMGKRNRAGQMVPRDGNNFLRTRIHPIAERLGIPKRLVTFQVMRRTLGTDLQQHGSIKDAQRILRHADIQTTGNVYMQEIPQSVVEALESRTQAILCTDFKPQNTTVPNGSKCIVSDPLRC